MARGYFTTKAKAKRHCSSGKARKVGRGKYVCGTKRKSKALRPLARCASLLKAEAKRAEGREKKKMQAVANVFANIAKAGDLTRQYGPVDAMGGATRRRRRRRR